jgi:hypothetical protein
MAGAVGRKRFHHAVLAPITIGNWKSRFKKIC